MGDSVSALAGSVGVLFLVVFWLVLVALGLFWPLMAFFAVRHLKGIRRELERLNANVEQRPPARAPAHADRAGADELPLQTSGYYTRTGPLNIR